ncbi:hypothetical protein [Klebsiella phage vB_KshKPC-M]|nr:hypothetical protein [Klebsiella phage vB_KshKPC-M]
MRTEWRSTTLCAWRNEYGGNQRRHTERQKDLRSGRRPDDRCIGPKSTRCYSRSVYLAGWLSRRPFRSPYGEYE